MLAPSRLLGERSPPTQQSVLRLLSGLPLGCRFRHSVSAVARSAYLRAGPLGSRRCVHTAAGAQADTRPAAAPSRRRNGRRT